MYPGQQPPVYSTDSQANTATLLACEPALQRIRLEFHFRLGPFFSFQPPDCWALRCFRKFSTCCCNGSVDGVPDPMPYNRVVDRLHSGRVDGGVAQIFSTYWVETTGRRTKEGGED